jgi:hypothetical protein
MGLYSEISARYARIQLSKKVTARYLRCVAQAFVPVGP